MPASLRGLPTSMLSAMPISTVNTCAKGGEGCTQQLRSAVPQGPGTAGDKSTALCPLVLCCCQGRPCSNTPPRTCHRERFTKRTGMAGCMQVATVTPDISMPRMYSSCGLMAEGRQATVGWQSVQGAGVYTAAAAAAAVAAAAAAAAAQRTAHS